MDTQESTEAPLNNRTYQVGPHNSPGLSAYTKQNSETAPNTNSDLDIIMKLAQEQAAKKWSGKTHLKSAPIRPISPEHVCHLQDVR